MSLRVVPCSVKAAIAWVALHHSRLPRCDRHRFAVGIADGDRLVCVAVFGDPARLLCGGTVGEVVRVASDGTAKHAASMAYGAIRRMALASGYRRILTYTHLDESAACVKGAGFWPTGITRGGEYDRPSRKRAPAADARPKIRWESGPDAMPLDREAAARVPDWTGRRAA